MTLGFPEELDASGDASRTVCGGSGSLEEWEAAESQAQAERTTALRRD